MVIVTQLSFQNTEAPVLLLNFRTNALARPAKAATSNMTRIARLIQARPRRRAANTSAPSAANAPPPAAGPGPEGEPTAHEVVDGGSSSAGHTIGSSATG